MISVDVVEIMGDLCKNGTTEITLPQEAGPLADTLKRLDKAAKALGRRIGWLAGGSKMTLILKKGA